MGHRQDGPSIVRTIPASVRTKDRVSPDYRAFAPDGGLYLLAVVMSFMFVWNNYIAWVLITEVSEAG